MTRKAHRILYNALHMKAFLKTPICCTNTCRLLSAVILQICMAFVFMMHPIPGWIRCCFITSPISLFGWDFRD